MKTNSKIIFSIDFKSTKIVEFYQSKTNKLTQMVIWTFFNYFLSSKISTELKMSKVLVMYKNMALSS